MSNPFSSPTSTVMRDESFAEAQRTFGGIRRLPYWGSMIAIAVIHFSILYYSEIALWDNPWFYVLYLVLLYVALPAVHAFRLMNIGMHPLWFVLILVPLLNIFLVARCAIFPEGYAVTKKLDFIGKCLVFGFLILVVFVVVGVAVGIIF